MSNFQNQLTAAIALFVGTVTDLARSEAQTQLEVAFGHSAGAARVQGPRVGGGAGRGKGNKRSSEELDKLMEQFVGFVVANPGNRIEQINKQLGTNTKDLQLVVRKALAQGLLKAKGQKRSTTYTATAKATKAATPAKKTATKKAAKPRVRASKASKVTKAPEAEAQAAA